MEQSLSSEADSHSGDQEILSFMKLEGPLLYSWEPVTGPYPEPVESGLLSKIVMICSHLCIEPQLVSFLPSGFPTSILYVFLMSHACYISCWSHSSWCNHPNSMRWRLQRTEKICVHTMWRKYVGLTFCELIPHSYFLISCNASLRHLLCNCAASRLNVDVSQQLELLCGVSLVSNGATQWRPATVAVIKDCMR